MRLKIAVTISLLAHLLGLLLWQWSSDRSRSTMTTRQLTVKLDATRKVTSQATAVATDSVPAVSADPTPVTETGTDSSTATVSRPRMQHDIRTEILRALRGLENAPDSVYLPARLQNPGLRPAPVALVPQLDDEFRRVKPRQLCGREAEFEVGLQKFTMPVVYACDEKQEEFDLAPGAGVEDGRSLTD